METLLILLIAINIVWLLVVPVKIFQISKSIGTPRISKDSTACETYIKRVLLAPNTGVDNTFSNDEIAYCIFVAREIDNNRNALKFKYSTDEIIDHVRSTNTKSDIGIAET